MAPILLVLLVVPGLEWEVNGRAMSYAEMWSSGEVPAVALSLALVGIGAWGLAARRRAYRWPLVFSPVAPSVILAIFPWTRVAASTVVTTEIVLMGVGTAIAVYVCLFHLRGVRAYLDKHGVGP